MTRLLYSSFLPIVLGTSGLASIGSLLIYRPKRIQLPTSDTDPPTQSIFENFVNDPFDIATSEELSDGLPIKEDEFWIKVGPMTLCTDFD